MNAVWTVCRIIAVTLLAAITVGWACDWTASDLADGARFLFIVMFIAVSLFSAVLLCMVLVDLWREARSYTKGDR